MKFSHGLNVLWFALSILMLTACATPQQQRLREAVNEFARSCPVSVADGVTIDGISYDDDVVTYQATFSTPLVRLAPLAGSEDTVKQALLQMIAGTTDSQVRHDLQLCRDAGASLRFVLIDADTRLTLTFSPDELNI